MAVDLAAYTDWRLTDAGQFQVWNSKSQRWVAWQVERPTPAPECASRAPRDYWNGAVSEDDYSEDSMP